MFPAAPQKHSQTPAPSKKIEGSFFQPKLTINQPNDMYEQEADAMADKVMRMPQKLSTVADSKPFFSPSTVNLNEAVTSKEELLKKENKEETEEPLPGIQAKLSFDGLPLPPDINRADSNNSIQRKCAHCEEEEKLQRKETTAQATEASSETSSYINSLSSKGSSLSKEDRSFFEPRMGYDFSDVKIHTDNEAAKSAQSVNALAYTTGNNIVFNQSQFFPASDDGKKLLAHELTHVVQQQLNTNESFIQRSVGSNAGGCGLCYGSPKNVGSVAHKIIEKEFRNKYSWVQTEYPVLGSPTDSNGKLDLADLEDTEKISIGEIKPSNPAGLFEGDLDLYWYEDQLQKLGMKEVKRMTLPPPMINISFPTLAPSNCLQTQQLFIEPPAHGIYTYYCEPDFKELVRDPNCKCKKKKKNKRKVKRDPVQESMAHSLAVHLTSQSDNNASDAGSTQSSSYEIDDSTQTSSYDVEDSTQSDSYDVDDLTQTSSYDVEDSTQSGSYEIDDSTQTSSYDVGDSTQPNYDLKDVPQPKATEVGNDSPDEGQADEAVDTESVVEDSEEDSPGFFESVLNFLKPAEQEVEPIIGDFL